MINPGIFLLFKILMISEEESFNLSFFCLDPHCLCIFFRSFLMESLHSLISLRKGDLMELIRLSDILKLFNSEPISLYTIFNALI